LYVGRLLANADHVDQRADVHAGDRIDGNEIVFHLGDDAVVVKAFLDYAVTVQSHFVLVLYGIELFVGRFDLTLAEVINLIHLSKQGVVSTHLLE
jgi:hypothetical protein